MKNETEIEVVMVMRGGVGGDWGERSTVGLGGTMGTIQSNCHPGALLPGACLPFLERVVSRLASIPLK